ncbi:hypothetical protein Hanom_Chr03g00196531 [Helianthus anomalus]
MAMGIYRQRSLSGGELGRKIPSAIRGTVQLPFLVIQINDISPVEWARLINKQDILCG